MIDLLIDDQRSRSFKEQAIDSGNSLINSKAPRNSGENEYFGLDGQLVDRLRPKLQSDGYAGIRIAFCLDQPILPDGNLFPRQQIQICLSDCSVIREPRRYIPGLLA